MARMLERLGYHLVGSNYELRHIGTGARFAFIDQDHYETIGDLVLEVIQDLMVKDYGMQRCDLPSDADLIARNKGAKVRAPLDAKCPIFVSNHASTAKKLLILLCGSGSVEAGQWGRSLCINDSFDSGTVLPFLRWAHAQPDTAVVVLNPNHNTTSEDVYIPYNGNACDHMLYAWDAVCKDLPAERIAMVAHSAGGSGACKLLKFRESGVLPRLKCIAFTDCYHESSLRNLAVAARRFVVQKCREWIGSTEPLGTVLRRSRPPDSFFERELNEENCKGRQAAEFNCTVVSAGTNVHDRTTMESFSEICDFIQTSWAA